MNESVCRPKIERGDRVFPVSDHSSDVIRGLEREMDRLGVKVHLRTAVKKVVAKDGHFEKIILGDQRQIHADACIVATGGLSYSQQDNRRWIPVCRKSRTYGDGLYACACADGM